MSLAVQLARMDLFDANVYIGSPAKGICRAAPTPGELMDELAPAGIARALVWHVAQHDCSAPDGNRLISEAIVSEDRLVGCWTILPPQTHEVIDEGFSERMKDSRVAALRAFPDHHRFLLNRVTFGGFLDEVCERRIPVLLSLLNGGEGGITWPAVYALMEEYPQLTCVLCDTGVWGYDRYTWPLLQAYANVYVETSMLSLEAGGLEATINRFGSQRLIFGSGFPVRYPHAAALQLLHAAIPDDDRQMIASGNLKRMLSEARL